MNFTSSFFCLFFSLALPKYLNYSSEYCSRILTICKYDSNQINKNLFLISATPIVTRVIIWSYKIQNIMTLICTVRTVQSTVQSTVLDHKTMYCLLSGLYKSLYWFDLLWPVYYIPTVLGYVTMHCLLSGLYKSLYWIDLLWPVY